MRCVASSSPGRGRLALRRKLLPPLPLPPPSPPLPVLSALAPVVPAAELRGGLLEAFMVRPHPAFDDDDDGDDPTVLRPPPPSSLLPPCSRVPANLSPKRSKPWPHRISLAAAKMSSISPAGLIDCPPTGFPCRLDPEEEERTDDDLSRDMSRNMSPKSVRANPPPVASPGLLPPSAAASAAPVPVPPAPVGRRQKPAVAPGLLACAELLPL
jgi:hypothetical protein